MPNLKQSGALEDTSCLHFLLLFAEMMADMQLVCSNNSHSNFDTTRPSEPVDACGEVCDGRQEMVYGSRYNPPSSRSGQI